jgi:hypothetical protein
MKTVVAQTVAEIHAALQVDVIITLGAIPTKIVVAQTVAEIRDALQVDGDLKKCLVAIII